MLSSIKSEFMKFLTARTTWVTFGFLTLFMVFFAFFAQGIHAQPGDPTNYSSAIVNGTSVVAFIMGIFGVLCVALEYRYNTIMYTLTSSNSRSKSLFAKFFVMTIVSLLSTGFFIALIPLLINVGANVANVDIGPQTVYYRDVIWQCLFASWGIMMYALIIATFIRHQVGSIVTYFVIPTTLESLMILVLKDNAIYQPFNIVGTVASLSDRVSPEKAALISLIYIVGGGIIAFISFVKRDAN